MDGWSGPFADGLPRLPRGARVARSIDGRVKVILMSGEIDPARRTEMLAAGAAGFLKKPFLPSEVSQLVRNVIDEGTSETHAG
jgi:DNA-binding NarL/FixJ family response regulator